MANSKGSPKVLDKPKRTSKKSIAKEIEQTYQKSILTAKDAFERGSGTKADFTKSEGQRKSADYKVRTQRKR